MAVLSHQYQHDFYGWIMHNSNLIRQGRLSEIDIENIAEELETMGRSEKRQLINRLAVLISHLLKWKFQPGLRGHNWKYTIEEQRISILELLEDSPSLKHEIESKFDNAYEHAIRRTIQDTGLDKNNFPKECPFTFSQCLDKGFFPGEEIV